MLISIITMFFTAGIAFSPARTAVSAVMLLGVIILGVLLTFGTSAFLSKTILKGEPSGFTLELPPYRTPRFGQVIVRSVFERTLFVLGRAVCVAAPAGLLIWLLANIHAGGGGESLLSICSGALDPFAKIIGLDGVILFAFILGFPANETVVPIIIMTYLAKGELTDYTSLSQLKELLCANGWTWITALCTMLFSLVHFPCSTTCITIYKETKSLKWTVLAILLPTACGIILCGLTANILRFFV